MADKASDDKIPVVKIGNLLQDGTLSLNEVQYHRYDSSLQRFLIQEDDILIAMTGATVGKVAISNTNNILLNQ